MSAREHFSIQSPAPDHVDPTAAATHYSGPERNRLINRQKLEIAQLETELADRNSLRSLVFARYSHLLAMRRGSSAFHPHGGQKILDLGPNVFAVLRTSRTDDRHILCLQNVTPQTQFAGPYTLGPYQTLWLDNPEMKKQ